MLMYTNNSDLQCVTSVPRRQTNGSRAEVSCPLAITSYNKNLAAVDKGDLSRGYYHCSIKSRKFINIYIYIYIYYYLFDVTITNAFILDRGWSGATEITIKQFRIQLAKELIGGYCSRYRAGYNGSLIKPLPFSHFPRRSQQHLQDSAIEVAALTAISRRKDATASGTATSVAYGCATLEAVLP